MRVGWYFSLLAILGFAYVRWWLMHIAPVGPEANGLIQSIVSRCSPQNHMLHDHSIVHTDLDSYCTLIESVLGSTGIYIEK